MKNRHVLPEHVEVSVLEMCLSYGMSVLKRFHCRTFFKLTKLEILKKFQVSWVDWLSWGGVF